MNEAVLPPSFAPPQAKGEPAKTAQQFAQKFRQQQSILSGTCDNMELGQLSVLTSAGSQKVSATAMKRVEEQLGKDALDDTSKYCFLFILIKGLSISTF